MIGVFLRQDVFMAFSAAIWFAAVAAAAPHNNFNATLWYQTSAEFRANSLQTYKMASLTLKEALTDKNWSALPNQTSGFQQLPPAIIVDIDETILDNSPAAAQAILEQDPGFNAQRWDNWVAAAKAKAVPGAVDFLNLAAVNGVTVLYISNRECAPRAKVKDQCPQKADTLKNLQASGINQVDASQLWLKSEQKDWTSEKESRRLKAAQQYRIIMLVGDDFGDFLPQVKSNITPAQRFELVDKYQQYWGSRWFMLTNPTYGSWETILQQPKQQYLQGF
jgi:acid phosphatase